MRVLVVGAYGLIGGYVTSRLLEECHAVTGAGRNLVAARRRFPTVEWVEVDLGCATVESWTPHLRNVDAVVNCAGALQDSAQDRLAAVHDLGLQTLVEACERAGVRRFVQISAAGVDAGGDRFRATKAAGDAALMGSRLDWVILRPGLVLARGVFGGSALLRGLAGLPLVTPVLAPDAVVQVVDARDVGEAVGRSLGPGAPSRIICDLVAREETTLVELLARLRGWLGFRAAPVVRVPSWFGRGASLIADGLSYLGWRSPMRSTALRQLGFGVRGEGSHAAEMLGFTPKSLQQILAAEPSSVSDRWFARLYFAKPLGLVTLAAFWAASGVIGLVSARAAVALLATSGFQPAVAEAFVLCGSVIDIALAMLVCHRKTASRALLGMVGVTVGYLAAAALWTPHLWLDPLGPLVKSIPAGVLAIVVLAIMEER